jgi:hypothetical protein
MSRTTLTGPLPAELANAVSGAISSALKRGMEIDEAACVVAGVAADYARGGYGDAYLQELAEIVRMRAGEPMPEMVVE